MIDDLAPFYRDFSVPVTGAASFSGLLDTVDALDFDAATSTTHTLRYPLGPLLAAGDTLTIEGGSYKVIGVPRRVSSVEKLAHLVKQ